MISISVVIPAYNVQEYIGECLESIKAQTFCNYEVIVVNDGSTDSTQSICEQYNGHIRNLKIIKKSNEGQAIARNIGTLEAKGNYVCYIDSDDWIAPTYLETLYSVAVKFNYPTIIQCGYYYSYDTYLLTLKEHKNTDIKVLTKHEALKELIDQKFIKNFPWGKIIKTEVAKSNLMPCIPNYEDAYWFYKVIENCNKYIIINTPLYYYRQRVASMTHSINESCIYLLNGYKSQYYFIKYKYSHLTSRILEAYLNVLFNIYFQSLNSTNDVKEKISIYTNNFIISFKNDYINNHNISFFAKIKFFALHKNNFFVKIIHYIESITIRLKAKQLIRINK